MDPALCNGIIREMPDGTRQHVEYAGDRREVAGGVANGASEVTDRLRTFGDRVEVTQWAEATARLAQLVDWRGGSFGAAARTRSMSPPASRQDRLRAARLARALST